MWLRSDEGGSLHHNAVQSSTLKPWANRWPHDKYLSGKTIGDRLLLAHVTITAKHGWAAFGVSTDTKIGIGMLLR
jgi:hypothetical protein